MLDKLDILNREEFVNKLVNLTENISANKASTSFAINGTWGCGKSFVLDMYEEQISQIQSEETSTDKYFVIRYNCWEYDYYAEPLIAIVSSVVDAIEEKIKLFPDSEEKREIWGMWKSVGIYLLSIASDSIKEKTGIDIKNAVKVVSEGSKSGAKSYEEDHRYDKYFGFNKVISKLHELLENISEQYTVVFLVDELDRCLPEYSIKVLERLHHLTEDSKNVITVLSMDKEQLQTSVKQIFGFNDPAKYLEKFIQFEVKLDCGEVSEKVTEKFSDYIDMFDKDIFQFDDSIEEFIQAIFKDIVPRTQEHLVKRATVAHQLLYKDKKDYVFMCMELLLTVLICEYNDDSCFMDTPIKFDQSENKFAKIFVSSSSLPAPAFSEFFKEKYDNIYFRTEQDFHDEPIKFILPQKTNLYCAILFNWYWMHKKHHKFIIAHYQNDAYTPISKHYIELKKFAETIKLMK